MVVFDANVLSLLLHPKARPPNDPKTEKPVERVEDRLAQLVSDLKAQQHRVAIPTLVLAEFLVLAEEDGPKYLTQIGKSSEFVIVPFDERAAVELAAMEVRARKAGDKRGGSEAPWNKIKIDRQIVAISKVIGATTIYSDDDDIARFAAQTRLQVVRTWDLPLPPATQLGMEFQEGDASNSDS